MPEVVFCNSSFDCLNGFNDSITRNCYERAAFSDNVNFCDCSNWYGWVGKGCNVESSSLIYGRFFTVISAIWALVLLILTLRTTVCNIILGFGDKGFDPVFLTGIFTLLSTLSFLVFLLILSLSLFDPFKFEIITYRSLLSEEDIEEVTTTNGKITVYSLLFSSVFQLLAAIFIMLSWQRVVQKASKYKSEKSGKRQRIIVKRVMVVAGVWLLLLFISVFADFLLASAVFVAISSIFVSISYFFAARRLISVLENLQAGQNECVQLTLDIIRKVVKVNSVCLLFISFTATVYYILIINFEENLILGRYNYILPLRDFGILSGLVQLTYTSWYFNSVTDGVFITEEYPRLNCIFKPWDEMHYRMLYAEGGDSGAGRSLENVIEIQKEDLQQLNGHESSIL